MKEEIRNTFYKLKFFLGKYSIYFILMFAFMIRFNGLNFGLPYLYLPDELPVMNSVMHMLATGDLNPHQFTHPNSFVMYLLAILYAIILAVYLIYCFLLGYTHNLIDLKQLVRNNPIFFYFVGVY